MIIGLTPDINSIPEEIRISINRFKVHGLQKDVISDCFLIDPVRQLQQRKDGVTAEGLRVLIKCIQ